ncbi:hypothetical protein ACHAWT_003093 [Skeletonema menzelii]
MSTPRNATFIIPTKVGDNCSYSASLMQQVIGHSKESERDAFQYYSSDFIRLKLKTLLLSPDANEDDDDMNALTALNDALRSAGLSGLTANSEVKDDSKRRRGNNSQPIKQKEIESGTPRKTRLSWELHPNLVLHDLYDQVGDHDLYDYDQVGEDIRCVSDGEDNCREN